MKVKPLADRVVVEALEAEAKSAGGIIIPDNAKEKPQQGKVIAVGPGKIEDGKKIEMEVKAGDVILYGKYSGTEITIEGKEYIIMRESDILAKI
jgi:chaperonin GroES